MEFKKITESDSNHENLEKKSIEELLLGMHEEDKKSVKAVGEAIDKTALMIYKIVDQLKKGGRLFYIGAGTSGRLGVLDASECPPTFGTSPEKVIGLIAGGDYALRNSVETAEDDPDQAWKDLKEHKINSKDFIIGIAASGTTPYVIGGLSEAQKNGIPTGCIVSNLNSPVSNVSDFPVEVVVGPEFVTGSSRMKAGTAQKLILNSITTATMIQLGHIRGNKMVDMQLSNDKLTDRAERMVMEATGANLKLVQKTLQIHRSARKAIDELNKKTDF